MTEQTTLSPAQPQDKHLRFRALFLEEAGELLQEAECCLQLSRDGTPQDDTPGILFRGVHTIKSGAASFEMPRTVAFAHAFESVLQELRNGSYQLDDIRLHMFFRCYDMLASLLQAETGKAELAAGAEAELLETIESLTSLSITAPGAEAQMPTTTGPRADSSTTIRVELPKIDRLVNLTSELTILESMLRQKAEELMAESGQSSVVTNNFTQSLDQLSQHLRDLHAATMETRAQPLGAVFQRLPRVVRELARDLGKQAELTMRGSEVEVDKTIIEQLAAPLTHILRNAIDHGIEPPEAREQDGKPPAGSIRIDARCLDNQLHVTIEDDGRGLNLATLRVKAGLQGSQAISDDALAGLIFQPGISTTEQVSEISGRGVGLDAVRHDLAAMGGTIAVETTAGQGTCFRISLPLTLAVMDGMTVTIRGESYVVPLRDIQEALDPSQVTILARHGLPSMIRYQEHHIPMADTTLLTGRKPGSSPVHHEDHRPAILILNNAGTCTGLLVDGIIGQQQVAVRQVQMAGQSKVSATILGNGQPAIILTAARIAAAVKHAQEAA